MPIAGTEEVIAKTMYGSSGSTSVYTSNIMKVIASGIIKTFLKCAIVGTEVGTVGSPPPAPMVGILNCPALQPATLAGVITQQLLSQQVNGSKLATFINGLSLIGTHLLTAQILFIAAPTNAVGAITVVAGQITYTGADALTMMKEEAKNVDMVNPKTKKVTEYTEKLFTAVADAIQQAIASAIAVIDIKGGVPVAPPGPYGPLPNNSGKFL